MSTGNVNGLMDNESGMASAVELVNRFICCLTLKLKQ